VLNKILIKSLYFFIALVLLTSCSLPNKTHSSRRRKILVPAEQNFLKQIQSAEIANLYYRLLINAEILKKDERINGRAVAAIKLPSQVRIEILPENAAYSLGLINLHNRNLLYLDQPNRSAYSGDLAKALYYLDLPSSLTALKIGCILTAKSILLLGGDLNNLKITKSNKNLILTNSDTNITATYEKKSLRLEAIHFNNENISIKYFYNTLNNYPSRLNIVANNTKLGLTFLKVKEGKPSLANSRENSFYKLFKISAPTNYTVNNF
jgi:hypothetical protein